MNFDRLGSVNADHLYSVSRTNAIDVVVIADNCQRVRSFSFRHILRQLLKLYVLLVCELAQIVDDLECVLLLAASAVSRLLNLCIFESNSDLLPAQGAPE